MKERKPYILPVAAGAALMVILGMMAGCEDAEGLIELHISPGSVLMGATSNIVRFTVSGNTNDSLALPVSWDVTDRSLGTIIASSGFTALYARTGLNGDNIITARDQYGNSGLAMVKQTSGSGGLALSATQADSDTWTVAVSSSGSSGSTYEWWVSDRSLGSIESLGSTASAVYTASTAGTNTVFARDNSGLIGSVVLIFDGG